APHGFRLDRARPAAGRVPAVECRSLGRVRPMEPALRRVRLRSPRRARLAARRTGDPVPRTRGAADRAHAPPPARGVVLMLFLGKNDVEAAGLRMPEVVQIVAATLEDKSAGRVGAAALQALRLTLPGLRSVRAWAPRAETARRFADEQGADAAATAEEAVRGADVIVSTAPWPGGPPGVEPAWIRPGAFACSLDYDATFTPAAAAAFDVRVADDVPQMDLARAKGSFAGWPRFSELCTARRKDPDQRILCAALGLAIFDIAVATRILHVATARRSGRERD